MSSQSALYRVCDKSKCVDLNDQSMINSLSNPSRNNKYGGLTKYEKNISGTYKNNGDADKSCTEYNGDAPYCYFLNNDRNADEQWRADNMGLNKSSGNGNKGDLKNCPGSTSNLPNYKMASYIFRERKGADDVYKLCKRDIIENNKDNCCLDNNGNTAEKCPNNIFYGSGDCNNWRKDEINNFCKLEKNKSIDLSSGSKCSRLRDSNRDDFLRMADSYCDGTKSLDNWEQCVRYYGENDYLKNVAIGHCTDNSRLFNDKCLSQNGNQINNPGFLNGPISDAKVNYCKANPGDGKCENHVKDYNKYGDQLLTYCQNDNFKNISNTSCQRMFRIDFNDANVNNDLRNKIKNNKINYCNNKDKFNNDLCLNFVKENPIYYDSIISATCVNSTSDVCNYFNSRLPEAKQNKVKKCIDANNIMINTPECLKVSNDIQMIEPIMNFCKLESNAINNPICKTVLKEFSSNVNKSSFDANRDDPYDNNNSAFYLFLLFIFIILISVIIYKKCFNVKNNLYQALYK